MDILTEDAMLKIIEYLDLKDQVQLHRALDTAPYTHLSAVITYSLQRRTKYSLNPYTLECPQILNAFLQCICPTVKELTLTGLPRDQLEQFYPLKFPAMLDLISINIQRNGKFFQCFSNLESLTMIGGSAGKYINRFRKLQRLDVDFLYRGIPFLRGLEEMKLTNAFMSRDKFETIVNLPKLRELVLVDLFDGELEYILKKRGQDVLAANISLFDGDFIRFETMRRNCSRFFQSPEYIWSFVAACPKLKILTVSDFDNNFCTTSTMKRVLDLREDTLVMHLPKNKNQSLICNDFKHPKLVISFEDLKRKHQAIELKLLPRE
ncbi:hypothetical protein KR018_010107 [Drosophila ironensis]|nr:hypothetical protein KR018_010107 [Drosophila ironensis]